MRLPTKIDSIRLLRKHGLNPTTVIDIGAGKRGSDCLFRNFKDKKTILVETDEKNQFSLIDSMEEQDVGDYEIIFMKAGKESSDETVTLKEIAYDCEPSYLIKIDVDGDDLDICRGGVDILTNTDCVIVEANAGCINWGHKRDVSEFIRFFDAHGFHLFDMVDALYYNDILSSLDLVFISNDMKKKFNENKSPWKENVENDNVRFERLINENGHIAREFSDFSKSLYVTKKSNTEMWKDSRCI